jgi:hypothetical protein
MARMFKRAHKFNNDVRNWDVKNVLNMHSMFERAVNFETNIDNWKIHSRCETACAFNDSHVFIKNQQYSEYIAIKFNLLHINLVDDVDLC